MEQFASGNVEACVVAKQYQSGSQYTMAVGGKQFKAFYTTGQTPPAIGTNVNVVKGKNARGYDEYTVTPVGGVTQQAPVQQQSQAQNKGGYTPCKKDAETQLSIEYQSMFGRCSNSLAGIVANNIALINAGKKTGMTLSMLEHLTTVDGFMAQVAEMTRTQLDVLDDIENFNGNLPTFIPPEEVGE